MCTYIYIYIYIYYSVTTKYEPLFERTLRTLSISGSGGLVNAEKRECGMWVGHGVANTRIDHAVDDIINT